MPNDEPILQLYEKDILMLDELFDCFGIYQTPDNHFTKDQLDLIRDIAVNEAIIRERSK